MERDYADEVESNYEEWSKSDLIETILDEDAEKELKEGDIKLTYDQLSEWKKSDLVDYLNGV